MKEKTLAEIFLYLDSIIVDGYFLTRDQGALVAGLLEGHSCKVVFTFDRKREAEPLS
jgi:hypothetical protein